MYLRGLDGEGHMSPSWMGSYLQVSCSLMQYYVNPRMPIERIYIAVKK